MHFIKRGIYTLHMIPVNYAQIALTWRGGAVRFSPVNVFGVDNTVLSRTAAQLCTDVESALNTSGLMGRLSTSINIGNIRAKLGPDATGPFADYAPALVGGSAGDVNPSAALLIVKQTALGGRKNRGRMFLPGLIEADIGQAGVITNTALGAFATQCTAFLNALAAASIPMVILHADATTPTPITSLGVESLISIQHRRLRR